MLVAVVTGTRRGSFGSGTGPALILSRGVPRPAEVWR
jgi:hypothetical protein